MHEANYWAYGYRRTWIALRRQGEEVGRGRVQRLMRAAGIQGAKRRGKPWRTTTPDPTAERWPDLVERDFSASAPNRLWVGDFTYLRSWEGISLLRLRDRRLLAEGSSAGSWPPTCAPTSSSTRCGWPWANESRAPTSSSSPTPIAARNTPRPTTPRTLDDAGVLASVGTVGDAYDNAMAESFVDTFKTELVADRVWRSRSQRPARRV